MKSTLAAILFLSFSVSARSLPDSVGSTDTSGRTVARSLIGAGLLLTEFVVLPALDGTIGWEQPLRLQNPFRHIRETEPYIQDELWHFVGASASTNLNYHILRTFFDARDPVIAAGALSLLNWTIMECLDGMAGSGFSITDQIGNTLGAAFGMLSLTYPRVPVKMRVGVRNWSDLVDAVSDGVSTGNYSRSFSERYTFMKTELIYMHQTGLYGGLAVSTHNRTEYDMYGVTAGFDIIKWLNDRKEGWWNGPAEFTSSHFSAIVSFTWWAF